MNSDLSMLALASIETFLNFTCKKNNKSIVNIIDFTNLDEIAKNSEGNPGFDHHSLAYLNEFPTIGVDKHSRMAEEIKKIILSKVDYLGIDYCNIPVDNQSESDIFHLLFKD